MGLLLYRPAGSVACEPFVSDFLLIYCRNWTGTEDISLGMAHSLGLPEAEPFVGWWGGAHGVLALLAQPQR